MNQSDHGQVAHLTVGQLVPGLLAVGEDLPQDHAEAPDVALGGELPVHDALRRHPADRQHGAPTHLQREAASQSVSVRLAENV